MSISTNRTPILQLTDAQQVEQSFRAADKQLRVNRQGGKYILLRLADRTGVIAGMMWNADERVFDSFSRGDYLFCRGRTQVHNGALQVIVSDLERMDPAEVNVTDFEQFDAQQSDLLMARLGELFGQLKNVHLRQLGQSFLNDPTFVSEFRVSPAAVSNHHAYPGGLLQHTVELMELASLVSSRYPQLDADLLVFGAFLHDLGKIEEMSTGGEASYTDRGQMIGHIVIGIQLLYDKINQTQQASGATFPAELRLHLEHMIVSHHGQLEFGSPRLPVTLEAVALHHLDNLDAKLAAYTNVIDTDVAADGNWTNYSPAIGRKLWKKRD